MSTRGLKGEAELCARFSFQGGVLYTRLYAAQQRFHLDRYGGSREAGPGAQL